MPDQQPARNDALLFDWLTGTSDAFALARKHGLTLDQLIAWFESDDTQTRIAALTAIAEARAALLVRLHRAAAIDHLAQVVESPDADANQRLRAAIQVLRTAAAHDARDKMRMSQIAQTPGAGAADSVGGSTPVSSTAATRRGSRAPTRAVGVPPPSSRTVARAERSLAPPAIPRRTAAA